MPTGHETILVVEDDEDVRAFVCAALQVLGYHVLEAQDGPSALSVLDRVPDIDMLLADIVLPGGMSGREIAEEFRRRKPEIVVLFTSGYTENAIVHQGRLDSGVNLIAKPYRREALAERVRTILDDRAK